MFNLFKVWINFVYQVIITKFSDTVEVGFIYIKELLLKEWFCSFFCTKSYIKII